MQILQEKTVDRKAGSSGKGYRVITRGDFDGLVSAVLFSSLNQVDSYYLTHARALHGSSIAIDSRDVILNLPFQPGCAFWFDHHESETPAVQNGFSGAFSLAPSCARVICDYYSPDPQVMVFHELVAAADKIDSAQLDPADICDPQGWVLLANTLQSYYGGGPGLSAKEYFSYLVERLKTAGPDEVLQDRDVLQRVRRFRSEQALALQRLAECSYLQDGIIIADTRKLRRPAYGNRFLIYTLFPQATLSITVFEKERSGQTVFACAKNIFNRRPEPNIGLIMKHFGGGGHAGAGSCSCAIPEAEGLLSRLQTALRIPANPPLPAGE